jgi:basic amino acid/polyamine antiporter, APA family
MEKKQGTLVRTLTLTSAVMLVISSVIGSGVYKKIAPMSAELQSPSLVLWCWVAAGVISLCGALSNAEIAGMLADSGGEYVYFRRIYGKFTAFLWGWTTFAVIKTASISALAYVFAQSVNAFASLPHLPKAIEQIEIGPFQPFDNFGVKALAIALILLLTWVNTRGVKGAAFLSGSITQLVVIGLTIIVASSWIFGGGKFEHITTPATTQTLHGTGAYVSAFFSASLAAFWAYEGWNTVGFIGGEIQNPNRNLPLALFTGMMAIIATYLIVNFTYMYIISIDDFINIHKTKNDIAAVAVMRHVGGTTGALLLSVLMCITTLGCTNSTILMPPRIYYAMAKDNLFFKSAADIDPVSNTPNNALWIQGVWACALILSGSFDQLTDMLIFAAFLFYGLTALGVFILRVREPNAERPYKVIGYPIVPALFVLFCFGLVANTIVTKPREAIFGIMLILTGIPFYFYWTRAQEKV